MHFREQGKSLQLVRTTYESEKGRGVQKVVARLPRFSYTVPENVKALLTQDELVQLSDYLKALQAQREQDSHTLYARSGHAFVRSVREAIESKAALDDPEKLWAEIALLTKALRKAGYPRPKKAASDAKPA